MALIFANKGIATNMVSFSVMFLYGIDLAKQLQPCIMVTYTFACVWMLIYNNWILNCLGVEALCYFMIGISVLIFVMSFFIDHPYTEEKKSDENDGYITPLGNGNED